jgi:hypothetical protein
MEDDNNLYFRMEGTFKTLEEAKFYKQALIDNLGFNSLNDDEVRIGSKYSAEKEFYDFFLVLTIDLRRETNASKLNDNGRLS